MAPAAGCVFTWGRNTILGHKEIDREAICPFPVRLKTKALQNNVIHVSTGQCGMGAVTEDGELYIWGQSFAMGALRTGNHTFDLPQNAPLPRKALFFSRFIVRSVACGQETMGAIVDGVQKKQGLVYMWGKSRNGACGSGTDEKRQYTPRLVMLNKTKPLMCVIQLSVGNLTAAAIVDTAHVVDHGANDGNAGDSVCKLAVSTTTTSNDSSNSGMATRNELSSAVYSWGNGTFGILGHGDSKHRPVAREIKALAGKGVRRIHFGSAHAACVTSKGELYTWGYGGSGCLGHGNRADRSIPTLVTFSRTQGRRKQEHKHKNARTTERTSHGNSDTTQKQKQEQKRSDSDDGGRKDAVTIGDADVIGAVAGVNKNNKDSDEDNEQYEDEHSVFITDVHCSVGMPTFEVAGKNRSAVKGKEQPHTLACSADGRAWSWGTGHKGICGNTTKKGLHLHGNFDELTPYRIGDRTRDEGKSGYLKDTSIISVRSSAIHSGVLSSAGKLYMFGCGSGGRMGLRAFEFGLHGKRSRMKCYIMKPTALEAFVEAGVRVHMYDTSRATGIAIGTYDA